MKRLLASLAVVLSPFAGCPATTSTPVPPTRTAYEVESELEGRGCAPDGGLAALEDRHAKLDSGLECLFSAGGSVGKCGCP